MQQAKTKLDVKVNAVFYAVCSSKSKVIVLEGGTGAGKTWGVLENIIFNICFSETGKVISIMRMTFKEMKTTVIRDFYQILTMYGIYDSRNENKTNHTYILNGNTIEFCGIDQQKTRGARRDYLYINEANEIMMDDWVQLYARTRQTIWIDYNPTFLEHNVLDAIIGMPGTGFYRVNYLDNWDFLSEQERTRIQNLALLDPFYEKTLVLGERSIMRGQVFTNWNEINEWPPDTKWSFYGLDFGFSNSSTALVRVGYREIGELILEEKIYEVGMTNLPAPGNVNDKFNIHSRMLEIGITRTDEIWADSARTDNIAELHRSGWNIKPVSKTKDSITVGIEILKRFKIKIVKGSKGMKKEAQFYKWKEDTEMAGGFSNEPVDRFNDCWDAVRYVALTKLPKPQMRRVANV